MLGCGANLISSEHEAWGSEQRPRAIVREDLEVGLLAGEIAIAIVINRSAVRRNDSSVHLQACTLRRFRRARKSENSGRLDSRKGCLTRAESGPEWRPGW